MNFNQLEKTFEASIELGPPRPAGQRHLFRAKPHHLWCVRCHRVFPNGIYRLVAGVPTCPYGDCEASERDARAWNEIRQTRPNYAEYPQLGVRYPLRATVAGQSLSH